MNNKLRSAALIGSLLMTVTAAVPGGAVAEDALPARTYGGIPFMNGGVGVDEAQFMRSVARNYSLRLQFAGKSREFVADVSAAITDSRGETVFKVDGIGPLLYLNPPPGRYKVSASFNGVTQTREVNVPQKGGIDLVFVWNAPSSEPIAPPEPSGEMTR